MIFEDGILKNEEAAVFSLRSLYQKYGYSRFKMSKFEEYDLYAVSYTHLDVYKRQTLGHSQCPLFRDFWGLRH